MLNASWGIVIFVWKFPNFRYHGNRGWSDTNFIYTVKSEDPENPLLAQESRWYLIHNVSYSLKPIFWRNLPIFVTMATSVSLAKIEGLLLIAGLRKLSVWCKILGPILLWFLCGNFQILVTMATGVGVTQISLTQLNGQTTNKNPYWRKNLDDILYTSWVIANFLTKFTNYRYRGNKGGF